jgi:hypothetical protein
MVCVFLVCAHLLALEQGFKSDGNVIRGAFKLDVVTGNAFVDMHAKCGDVNKMFKIMCK